MSTRKPSTVGEILRHEYMTPLGLTINEVADILGVHRNSIGFILRGKGGVSTLMAFKLARAFGTTPDFWLNLQQAHDLWEVLNNKDMVRAIDRIAPVKKED